jgi:hypothetical protein
VNQFSDLNPYEPPVVQAELARPERPYQPPRAAKPSVPYFSLIWMLIGPIVWIYGMRFCAVELGLFGPDDHLIINFGLTMCWVVWGCVVLRCLVWFCRSLFS